MLAPFIKILIAAWTDVEGLVADAVLATSSDLAFIWHQDFLTGEESIVADSGTEPVAVADSRQHSPESPMCPVQYHQLCRLARL